MFWFFGHEAHGVLAPRPHIEPTPPALEGEVLNTGQPGKSQSCPKSHANQSSLGSPQALGGYLYILYKVVIPFPLHWEYEKMSVSRSCPALRNPVDCGPPGSSVHGVSQSRILEWVAISFSRRLPDPGIEPGSSAWQADSLPSKPPGKPLRIWSQFQKSSRKKGERGRVKHNVKVSHPCFL